MNQLPIAEITETLQDMVNEKFSPLMPANQLSGPDWIAVLGNDQKVYFIQVLADCPS